MNSTRLLSLGGLFAPIFYVSATVLTLWLREGDYSLTLDTVSQLSNLDDPFGLLFILGGAVPVGVLAIAFAYSIWFSLPESSAMHFGVILLSLEGMAIVVSFAVFPRSGPDPGLMHVGAGLIALACGVGGRLLLARPLEHLGRFYRPFTLAVAVAVPVLLVLSQVVSSSGLYERTAHAILFVWMGVIAATIALTPEETEPDDPVPGPTHL